MPPSRRAHRTDRSPFPNIYKMKCFDKQLQIFGAYGCVFEQLELPNGDIIVKGDCVEIDQGEDHSATSYRGERWIAEVVEIKGEDENAEDDELYLQCNWFYSEINLQRFHCTVGNLKNELALSNHQQVIAANTVLRKATVRFFNELDRKQEPIGKKELWYRQVPNISRLGSSTHKTLDFSFKLRVGSGPVDNRLVIGKNRPLPPARCAVETCTKRYKPDEDYQRLCPRASCGFWYHIQCLVNVRFERRDNWHYNHRLLAMLMGTTQVQNAKDNFGNDVAEVPPECYEWLEHAIEEERQGVIDPKIPRYDVGSIANIVWCAQTPISRGRMYGIVGNEWIVAEARRLLKEIWDFRDAELFPTDEEVARFVAYKEPPKDRMFSCMRCGLAI
ncbi:hypothetical protein FRC08_008331 [Ceratobasidium sp. 394]|nr:hypothetical protein FRC08_008331 [Ceratobasidium sp. 394]